MVSARQPHRSVVYHRIALFSYTMKMLQRMYVLSVRSLLLEFQRSIDGGSEVMLPNRTALIATLGPPPTSHPKQLHHLSIALPCPLRLRNNMQVVQRASARSLRHLRTQIPRQSRRHASDSHGSHDNHPRTESMGVSPRPSQTRRRPSFLKC